MKTLISPSGGRLRVNDASMEKLVLLGYKLEPVEEKPKPAPKAPAKPKTTVKKTPAKPKES